MPVLDFPPPAALVSDEVAHAIGVIAVEWQAIEAECDNFLTSLPGCLSAAATTFLLHHLKNGPKADLIRASLDERRRLDPEGCRLVAIFLDFAHICAENRNTILHALPEPPFLAPDHAHFRKLILNKPGKVAVFRFSARDLMEIAEEMRAVRVFGSRLNFAFVFGPDRVLAARNREPLHVPLPDIPPAPRRLTPHRPEAIQDTGFGQPQSFED